MQKVRSVDRRKKVKRQQLKYRVHVDANGLNHV